MCSRPTCQRNSQSLTFQFECQTVRWLLPDARHRVSNTMTAVSEAHHSSVIGIRRMSYGPCIEVSYISLCHSACVRAVVIFLLELMHAKCKVLRYDVVRTHTLKSTSSICLQRWQTPYRPHKAGHIFFRCPSPTQAPPHYQEGLIFVLLALFDGDLHRKVDLNN